MARPKKISRKHVVEAAYRRVAAEGLAGLSMRGVGKDLGVEAMSLYKHVGRREDLVELLRAELFSTIRLPERAKPARRDLEAVCTALFRGLSAANGAPLLLPPPPEQAQDAVPESGVGVRPQLRAEPTPPPWLPIVERLLASLREFIPGPLDRAYAAHALFSFVMGQVVFSSRPGGIAGQRLEGISPHLAEFPEVTQLALAFKSRSPEVEFELGLRALLDAMEARRGF